MHANLTNFYLIFTIITFSTLSGFSQIFENPSFEGPRGKAETPPGWQACHELSTPDTQPAYFGVKTDPSDRETFVSMVTRGNWGPNAHTVEDMGTALLQPLLKGEQYYFSIDLAMSDSFGHSTTNDEYINYSNPVKLMVYGGEYACEKTELLWESPPVSSIAWKTFRMKWRPQTIDVNYIILTVEYIDLRRNFGNLLIDNIQECNYDIATNSLIATCPEKPLNPGFSIPDGEYRWSNGYVFWETIVEEPGPISVEVFNYCFHEIFEFEVEILDCRCDISAPNVITPNGDGKNDHFVITTRPNISTYSMKIYNRQGNQVFQSEDSQNLWDGYVDGRPGSTGTYYWTLSIQCDLSEEVFQYNGYINVLR